MIVCRFSWAASDLLFGQPGHVGRCTLGHCARQVDQVRSCSGLASEPSAIQSRARDTFVCGGFVVVASMWGTASSEMACGGDEDGRD